MDATRSHRASEPGASLFGQRRYALFLNRCCHWKSKGPGQPAVLKFIAKDLPAGMQLIVGLETPNDFPFDHQVILTEKYRMLTEDEWAPTQELMEPLLKKMYEATLSKG